MGKPGRRNTKETVATRRAQVYQWYTLGRWSPRDRHVLCTRWNISPNQLGRDLRIVKDEVAERMSLVDTEAIRADLVAQLVQVKRLASLHLMCRTCKGCGLLETEQAVALGLKAPPDAGDHIECEICQGTGANPETRPQWAKVIMDAVEQIRKLAGIEAAPETVVAVQVHTASPMVLLQQVQAGVRAIEAAGILTVPVED